MSKSDEQIIRDIISQVVDNIPSKNIAPMEAASHPQGVSISLLSGSITDRTLSKHLADLAEFPGVPGETIGPLDIRVFGKIAVATFDSEISSNGKPLLKGQNVITFHKVKVGEEEEWRITVIADSQTPVA